MAEEVTEPMRDKKPPNGKLDKLRSEYVSLAHAMQSGVAAKMGFDPSETSPKHLRVGVNTAHIDFGALMHLLIEKGIITEEERKAMQP